MRVLFPKLQMEIISLALPNHGVSLRMEKHIDSKSEKKQFGAMEIGSWQRTLSSLYDEALTQKRSQTIQACFTQSKTRETLCLASCQQTCSAFLLRTRKHSLLSWKSQHHILSVCLPIQPLTRFTRPL